MPSVLFRWVERIDEFFHRLGWAHRAPFYWLCDWRDRQYGYPGRPGRVLK